MTFIRLFLLAAIVSQVQVGCSTRTPASRLPDLESSFVQAEHSFTEEGDGIRVHCKLTSEPFSYQFKDLFVTAADAKDLLKGLNDRQVREIVLIFHYKLTQESAEKMIAEFKNTGVHILEFWVPRSTRPGYHNLVAARTEPTNAPH